MTAAATIQKRLSATFLLDVALRLSSGVTIMFGASGSGKTTLLRCLAGLLSPDSGRIVVGERVLFDSEAAVDVPVRHRRVGYVFQHLALFPHLTVSANIQYGLGHIEASAMRSRTHEIADSFRIGHLLDRKPGTISGGEQQRVALARSLVTDPGLLLLDEPLSAIDYVTQSRIIADLRVWNAARRIPIVYVTHAQREVFALGERVLVMERGRIVADGTPQEVMEAPARESIAQLAGFENILDATVVALRPEAGTMECRLTGSSTELEIPLFAAGPGAAIRLAIRAGDILMAIEPPRGLSARNVIPGRITSLSQEGTTVIAIVEAGPSFEVHLTPGARTALHLVEGTAIWLVIKTHSCRLVTD
jgi:molybdate transport system ATP-binding protein